MTDRSQQSAEGPSSNNQPTIVPTHTRIEVRGLDAEVVLQGQVPLAENILQVKQRIKVVSGRPTDQQDLLVSSQEEPLADDVTVRQARQVR